MIEVLSRSHEGGRAIYDDGVARAIDVGNDRFVLECAGRSVAFDVEQVAEAMLALRSKVGGAMSLMEASRAILDDIAERLPADGE